MARKSGVDEIKAEAVNGVVSEVQRLAPEILRDVMYEARSAAANIRRSGLSDKQAGDPVKAMSQLTTHQKAKVALDTLCCIAMQPEILLRTIQDALEETPEGARTRLALNRALIMAAPKELNIEVNSTQGVMLVPAKAESLDAWMVEAGLKQPKIIEGEVV